MAGYMLRAQRRRPEVVMANFGRYPPVLGDWRHEHRCCVPWKP